MEIEKYLRMGLSTYKVALDYLLIKDGLTLEEVQALADAFNYFAKGFEEKLKINHNMRLGCPSDDCTPACWTCG